MSKTMISDTKKLSNQVTSSAFWIFLFQVFDNLLGFIRLIVLARLLTPNDFGLVGIAWLILQIIDNFTQTGVQQTLIHKPKIESYLNTAWTYLAVRGLVIFGIIFVLAPYLGNFFNSTDSVSVIRAIGLTVLFNGFTNIGIIYFQKELQFNKQFIFQISGNIVDFIIAISLAIILKDVWAIIYGSIANSVVRLLLSYIISNFRPKIEFDISIYNELNNYGKWIAGSSIMQFIYSQGDDLLIGKIFNPVTLGLYQLAYKISNLPATQIAHLISSVMFPAYAQIQSDSKRIARIYLQVLQIVTFLSFFIGTIIILFAYDFTRLFLGDKWLPMVHAMQILTIWGILRSIGATTGPVWQALGTPKIVTKIQFIQVVILIIIIYPFSVTWNIIGTSWAIVISSLIPNIIAIFLINQTLKNNIINLLKELLFPFISCSVVYLVFLLSKSVLSINNFTFFIVGFICLITYLLTSFLLQKIAKYTIYINLINLANKTILNNPNNMYLKKIKSLLV